jgi:hypothetical protein
VDHEGPSRRLAPATHRRGPPEARRRLLSRAGAEGHGTGPHSALCAVYPTGPIAPGARFGGDEVRNVALVVVVIFLANVAACSGPSASPAPACTVPTAANTYSDGSNTGCGPSPAQNCTVDNGVETCTSLCSANQFYLACDGPLGTVGTAPSPDPSLNCTNSGGPTASYERDYCCACAQ